jgi:hypothetical protein
MAEDPPPAPPDADDTAPALPGAAPANYLTRHWRGDLPLPISYWVNGVSANIVALVVATAIGAYLSANFSPLAATISLTTVWLMIFVLVTWQFVGIWRSAGKHKQRGGKGFWGATARVLIVFGLIKTVADFAAHGAPALVEYAKILAGDERVGAHALHVLRNGTELEFAGGITFGTTDEIRQALDEGSQIKVLHLNSIGGRIAEGRKLRELIRERGLITYTATECDSACTIAFMGGKARYVGPNAKLGFHQAAFPGATADQIAEEDGKDKAALIRAGVATDFADRAYTTAHDKIWYPTTAELLAAHIITGVAAYSEFAVSGLGDVRTSDKVEAVLLKTPVYAAIKQAEPETFARIRNDVAQGFNEGSTESQIWANARSYITPLATKYLPVASDSAVLKMTAVVVAELEQAGQKDADACYYFLFPASSAKPLDFRNYFSADTAKQDLEALSLVIESGASAPQHAPPEQEIRPTLQLIVKRLAERNVDVSLLVKLQDPSMDHATVCAVTTAMYQEVLKLSPDLAASVLRYMYAGRRG